MSCSARRLLLLLRALPAAAMLSPPDPCAAAGPPRLRRRSWEYARRLGARRQGYCEGHHGVPSPMITSSRRRQRHAHRRHARFLSLLVPCCTKVICAFELATKVIDRTAPRSNVRHMFLHCIFLRILLLHIDCKKNSTLCSTSPSSASHLSVNNELNLVVEFIFPDHWPTAKVKTSSHRILHFQALHHLL